MTDLAREYWDWFLFDTLVWTGALIALVMLLRRPVSRHFGAGAAYALWFLPLARLLVPPVTLPAWMRPFSPSVAVPEPGPVLAFDASAIAMPVVEPGALGPTVLATPEAPVDFFTPVLLLWLGGAAVFLVRRFWLYFALRKELLEGARPVGEVGNIRLIETPAIAGPMAFGVIDRVIALPEGFMVSRDREQRDLAIEHELSHHRGGDLLVNMAIQPLFAVHWFNPLAYLGWHAMRRDQEAFCDARVVAFRPREERAAYAGIIADYARLSPRTPRPALAAPMACPVLGDKSIIHRLRNLSMSDISTRRRLTGRAAIAATFLAVPLTASIAYAELPAANLAFAAQGADSQVEAWTEADVQPDPQELAEAEIEIEEARQELEEADREMAEARREMDEAAHQAHYNRHFDAVAYADGRRQWAKGRIQYAEGRKQWADGRIQWAEGRKQWAKAHAQHTREQLAHSRTRSKTTSVTTVDGVVTESYSSEYDSADAVEAAVEAALKAVPQVVEKCIDPLQPVTVVDRGEGATIMYVCEKAGDALALNAVRSARSAIARDRSLDKDIREEILRELDAEIRELERAI